MTTNCLTTDTLIVCNLPPKLWNPAFWMNCVAFHPLILCYNFFLANHSNENHPGECLTFPGPPYKQPQPCQHYSLQKCILSQSCNQKSEIKGLTGHAPLPRLWGESFSTSSSFWSSKHSLVSGGIIPFSASIFTGPSSLLSLFLKFCSL